ncbi:hypothetical protein R1sor_026371 [Riccia sorocarpa]|uniref:Uncharacterized protein n=1 Tax=Riccia sorocarpa TaxID=122646 RepID=A0ABD3GB68_9MARC
MATWLFFDDHERSTSRAAGEPLLKIFDKKLEKHNTNLAYIILFTAVLRTNWAERNSIQFENKTKYQGLNQITAEVTDEIMALRDKTDITDKEEQMFTEAMRYSPHWEHQTTRWLGEETSRQQLPLVQSPDTLQPPKSNSYIQPHTTNRETEFFGQTRPARRKEASSEVLATPCLVMRAPSLVEGISFDDVQVDSEIERIRELWV